MASPWTDLARPPLSSARLRRELAGDRLWREVRVVARTGSTNVDVAAAARAGEAEGLVVIAEQQTLGRGRLDRSWSSPARAGVYLSVLVRPVTDASTWPLLPLLSGLAVLEAVSGVGRVTASLKWPNDVLIGDRKVAGILAERVDTAVVIGIGLNVSTRPEELPVDTATSLAIAGGATDREMLTKEVLRSLERRYAAWCDTQGAASTVLPAYREQCATIGRHVSVSLPGGDVVSGAATAVDDSGRLVVRPEADPGQDLAFSAGDVTHVRGHG